MERRTENFSKQGEIILRSDASEPITIEAQTEVAIIKDEKFRHAINFEPQNAVAQAQRMSLMNELEIQEFSAKLSKIKTEQFYELISNDALHSDESAAFEVRTAEVEARVEVVEPESILNIIEDGVSQDYLDYQVNMPAAEISDQMDDTEGVVENYENRMVAESLDVDPPVEELISSIEETFASYEEEVFGELLIAMITGDIADSYQDYDDTTVGINGDEFIETSNLPVEITKNPLEEVVPLLAEYEAEMREQAIDLISLIYKAANELKSEVGLSEEEKGLLIIEIEQNIEELFTVLGIEIDEDKLQKYVELLVLTLSDELLSESIDIDTDYLNRMGTREYAVFNKRTLAGVLPQIDDDLNIIEQIGGYTIKVCSL